jgi:hypothetical protein
MRAPKEFVAVSKELAIDFHSRQDNRIKPGVLMLMRISAGNKMLFLLIKYDHERVLTYAVQSRRALLRDVQNSFTQSPGALHKSALIQRLGPVANWLLLTEPCAKTLRTTIAWFRLQSAACTDQAGLAAIVAVSQEAMADNFGTVELSGQVGGQINTTTATFNDVQNDNLVLTLRKRSTPQWCYFLSGEGAIGALTELTMGVPRAVWVAESFHAFSTGNLHLCPWGGPQEYEGLGDEMELPRKLVRDQTHNLTSNSVIPWLLVAPPAQPSPIFARWRRLAANNLVFALPFEIRAIDGTDFVVLKGPRSQPIRVAAPPANFDDQAFDILVEAVRWVYSPRRDAEAKFLFLNRELSLSWRDADCWPEGLAHILRHSLTSARDEFAFYLQDQSRDAIKSLADLRKGLQEEVTKTQQATRDLLAALWRDFAVAALVLALRSPPISSTAILHPEVLRLVTLSAAALRSGRRVYRAVVAAMILVYLVAILYLINLAEPGLIERIWTGIAHVGSELFARAQLLMQDLFDLI